MVQLTYEQLVVLADGSVAHHASGEPVVIRRTTTMPDDMVLCENMAAYGPAHFPLSGVTLPAGGLWYFPLESAQESARLRILPPEEIKARTKRGKIESHAVEEPDPVTGISQEDLASATEPIPQVAPEEDG